MHAGVRLVERECVCGMGGGSSRIRTTVVVMYVVARLTRPSFAAPWRAFLRWPPDDPLRLLSGGAWVLGMRLWSVEALIGSAFLAGGVVRRVNKIKAGWRVRSRWPLLAKARLTADGEVTRGR